MKAFRVVTDSTADLPPQWLERYGISVVPLKVLFGSETFRDGVDLSTAQFFERLAGASQLPTTSAPSPGEFAEVYERLSRECEGVVSIHIGSNLSGTCEAARVGAQSVEGFPVHVVDSRTTTLATGFLCQAAAEQETLEAAVHAAEERVERSRVIALLDTLRYVEMGGRVSRAQAMIGTMLDLKPLLLVKDGQISSLDRVRTRSRAIPRMLERLFEDAPLERVAVLYGGAPEEAERVRDQVLAQLPGIEVVLAEIGSVLGTHTGPRALGFAYIKA